MRAWIRSPTVVALSADARWPSPESREMWSAFVDSFDQNKIKEWTEYSRKVEVTWNEGKEPTEGAALRVANNEAGQTIVFSAAFDRLGILAKPINAQRIGLLLVTAASNKSTAEVRYFGPQDLGT